PSSAARARRRPWRYSPWGARRGARRPTGTGTCRGRSTSAACGRSGSRTCARGPSRPATSRRWSCDRSPPSACQDRPEALGDGVGIADPVDALEDALLEVERDDRRGLGVILLDPRGHRLDGVVLAVHETPGDLRRRRVVLEVIDRAGLGIAAAAHRALLEQLVRHLDQDDRIELDARLT